MYEPTAAYAALALESSRAAYPQVETFAIETWTPKPAGRLAPNCGNWIGCILWKRDGGVVAMEPFDWVREHKVRSGLVVIALANVGYLLWCSMVDTPVSSFSKLLTPLVILSGVILGRPANRKTR
jgi:hypothetical protein